MKPIVLLWSLLIASVGGTYGIAALDLPSFGFYSLAPAPLLGQPIGYQTLSACRGLICSPIVQNSVEIASLDYAICFSIVFLISFALLFALRNNLLSSRKLWKRNILPIISLVVVSLIVAGAASGSVSSGASFTEIHWYGGVMAEDITFVQAFPGNASSQNSQGTSYVTFGLINNYWDEQMVTISVSVSSSSSTPVTLYQCSSSTECQVTSTIRLPSYASLSLNGSTSALYLGSDISKNQTVSYLITFSNGQSISGSVVAH